ncbi:Putative BTB/POZ domain-containing protein [Septoria linicola]|uniref:BTB/POZ domain-containing protein n=1 Tax=Septoria linicola TaxID=215465 RepID=A0A9Q9AYB5_9PEZI|nr:putative BTB/POZ domain-containing protein [Septoria linicola]USW54132.1 Putative BTB/POZ domain-containing protein [Septoria linicola]
MDPAGLSVVERASVMFGERLSDFARDYGDEYTDFTIKCGDRTWGCHRVILATSSEQMRQAINREGKDGVLDLYMTEEPLVDALLCSMYKADYEIPPSVSQVPVAKALGNQYVFHARMAILADTYDMPQMHLLARAKMQEAIMRSEDWATFLRDFCVAVGIAYVHQWFAEGVRSILTDCILSNEDDLLAEPMFQGIMQQHPQLGIDLQQKRVLYGLQ